MGIAFFHPAFLWALFAVAVPIIIHLLHRQRTVRLEFSSLRFLSTTAVKASRRRRLQRLLLLLARILLLATLIFLFARPFDTRDPFAVLRSPQAKVYSWIDPTMSMAYAEKGRSLSVRSLGMVDDLDSALPSSARMYVYDHDAQRFSRRHEVASPAISQARHGPSDFAEMIQALATEREKTTAVPVLLLFSDFQDGSVGAVDTFLAAESTDFPVVCVSVAPHNTTNARVSTGALVGQATPFVRCTVWALGSDIKNTELSVQTGTLRAGSAVVECAAGDSAVVEIEVSAEAGQGNGFVRLAVDDPLPFDNVDYFVRGEEESHHVLIVAHSEEAFPLIAAFQSLQGKTWASPKIVEPRFVTFEDIDYARVIVLSSVTQPSRAVRSLLGRSAMGKKVVLYSPRTDARGEAWHGDIVRYFAGRTERAHSADGLNVRLPDTVSRLWKGFPEVVDRSAKVHDYYASMPGTVLLRLSNRAPLVTHVDDSLGHSWLLFSTPLGIDTANNLCETGMYVPLLDRLTKYGLASVKTDIEPWIAGVPKRNPYYGSRTGAMVYDATGRSIAQWKNQPRVKFDGPGVYRVQAAGELGKWLTVKSDPSESRLVYQKPSVPAKARRFVKVVDAAAFRGSIVEGRANVPAVTLWVLLALWLVAEVLLWERKRA